MQPRPPLEKPSVYKMKRKGEGRRKGREREGERMRYGERKEGINSRNIFGFGKKRLRNKEAKDRLSKTIYTRK